jgi:hypothetical protein
VLGKSQHTYLSVLIHSCTTLLLLLFNSSDVPENLLQMFQSILIMQLSPEQHTVTLPPNTLLLML